MLPYVQSYNDPKIEKAYHRYLKGDSQRAIAKALNIPPRTVARYCKKDGWQSEREARHVAAEAPNVAAVAATVQTPAATEGPVPESRMVGMERMLGAQQQLTGLLVEAFKKDVEKTIADAATVGKPMSRSQIAQLTSLGNNLLTMQRKAWCVPDKIETKDTTPTAPDRVRTLKDDELQNRLTEARRAREEADRRRGAAAPRGGSATPSVN
jgi:hypothetical protein